jgi:hypothetical protein
MIEVADAFLAGYHGESFSQERMAEIALRRLRSSRRSAKRIFVTFVQSANLVAVIALISDPHPGTEGPDGGKLFDCEADSLRCSGEPAIIDRLAPSFTPTLRNEQLGR